MRERIVEQVLKTIRNYEMLKDGDSVLVALSGGPDSVFLLHALHQLRNKLKLKSLYVCNLDHGLRGSESREDSLFAKRLADESGLEFIHKKINIDKRKSKKLSTEEIAREARYRFFYTAAKKVNANVLATGHTLDDQAETILMRLIKGASLKGIIGIASVREERDLRIIRPLIEIEKNEIAEYLDGAKMSYRVDSTNLEPVYFRNIVRKEILPFLERYNPRLKRALFSLAEHLREDFQFIQEEKHRRQETRGKRQGACVEIDLKKIVVQPKAIQKEILRDLLDEAGGEVKKLSFRHWKELENLIRHKAKGNSVDLPGGIRVSRGEKTLAFSKN